MCLKKTTLVIILLLLMPIYTFGFQNEPDNFLGIKWGTNISELSDMILQATEGDNHKVYSRNNDKKMIGEAKITIIGYFFYKDRFSSALIEFRDRENFRRLKQTFIYAYGEGERQNKFFEYWYGENVAISFKYSEKLKKGNIFYYYIPIQLEKDKDDKKKAKREQKTYSYAGYESKGMQGE